MKFAVSCILSNARVAQSVEQFAIVMWLEKSLTASIDKCLLPEILKLWEMGIKTTGCCCGHGKKGAFIGVDFDDIQKMKNLGYKVYHNECRSNDEDSFIPKTVFDYQTSKCTEI